MFEKLSGIKCYACHVSIEIITGLTGSVIHKIKKESYIELAFSIESYFSPHELNPSVQVSTDVKYCKAWEQKSKYRTPLRAIFSNC